MGATWEGSQRGGGGPNGAMDKGAGEAVYSIIVYNVGRGLNKQGKQKRPLSDRKRKKI